MEQSTFEKLLADLPLGTVRYFDRIASTNDEAAVWAEAGAPDLSLVAADEQTAGRGRAGRQWFTPAGAALAFSLILRPDSALAESTQATTTIPRLTALGTVAVCSALQRGYGLPAQIKWPNDVLLNGQKTCGVLVETSWRGTALTAAILGIGVNVTPAAVPQGITLNFPATSIEAVLMRPVDRWSLLHAILKEIIDWRRQLNTAAFLSFWQSHLAFRGDWVFIRRGEDEWLEGRIPTQNSLRADGALRIERRDGEILEIEMGEVHLRPLTS
jgi:BirA family biotin operon repressor/biotin-[acetyl-CoA-carboxylase] ligase